MTFREGNFILFEEGRPSFVQCLKYSSASSLRIHHLSRRSCGNWKASWATALYREKLPHYGGATKIDKKEDRKSEV